MRYIIWLIGCIVAIIGIFSFLAFVRETKEAEAIAPVTGQFVQAHDIRLFIQTIGNKNDPALILIHGMAAWSETWRETMHALADQGWYVIAVDMPPFGFSDRPADHSYWRQSQAQRLIALMDALKLSRAVLVAHSYGSRAAIETSMRHGDRISGLVVVDPALDAIYSDPAGKSFSFLTRPLSFPPLRYAFVANTMTNPLLAREILQLFMHKKEMATREVLAVYKKPGAREGSTNAFGQWLEGFLRTADSGLSSSRENYEKLTMPVAIIWGREDTTTPLSQGEMLQSFIPDSKLTVINGVGHMPHLEDPMTFNQVLIEALQRIQ